MIKLIVKLKNFFFVGKYQVKTWDEMTMYEQWVYARNKFQHYAACLIFDCGGGFRTKLSKDERIWYTEQANKWDNIIKELQIRIIN